MTLLSRFHKPIKAPSVSEHGRKDSAVSIKSSLVKPDTAAFAFEVPTPTPASSSYPGPRLVKRSTFKNQKQKKTLYQLVSSTCQASCSLILQRSQKVEGLNLLWTDPAVVDFLLVCLSCERDRKTRGLALFPGKCSMSHDKVKSLADSLITLGETRIETQADGSTQWSAISSPPKNNILTKLTNDHFTLLRYVLHSAFAHLTSLSPTHHPNVTFPSLSTGWLGSIPPLTFLVTQQPYQKERQFRAYAARPKHLRVPVFHGTHPCRLPSILSQGLRNMSGTRYQKNGRCLGRGIYLAKDAQTSLGYAYPVEPWASSRFRGEEAQKGFDTQRRQVKVLLGCEVVVPEGKHNEGIIVEKDEGKVVVRFLWVLPGDVYTLNMNFEREVEDAMRALRVMKGE